MEEHLTLEDIPLSPAEGEYIKEIKKEIETVNGYTSMVKEIKILKERNGIKELNEIENFGKFLEEKVKKYKEFIEFQNKYLEYIQSRPRSKHDPVYISILDAYSDSNDLNLASGYRCTEFISEVTTIGKAQKYLKLSLGYNNFHHTNLSCIEPTAECMVAREGSVCIYFIGDKLQEFDSKRELLKYDEIDLITPEHVEYIEFKFYNVPNTRQRSFNLELNNFCLSRPVGEQEFKIYNKIISDFKENKNFSLTRLWWD